MEQIANSKTATTKRTLNCVVYYDNYREVMSYLDSLNAVALDSVDIIIVVNRDSAGESAKLLHEAIHMFPSFNIRLKDYGKNVGYLNALLLPIQDIDIEDYDYFILSNTDIEYVDKDFFNKLYSTKYPRSISCIAPDVYTPSTGSHSNPHYKNRLPKSKYNRLIRIFSLPILAGLYTQMGAKILAHTSKRDKTPQSEFVYAPHGCYMILTKPFIKLICGYTYGVKLYSEEAAIGELSLKHGFKCFYDSNLVINHNESTVTGSINQKSRYELWRESLIYIRDTFYQ